MQQEEVMRVANQYQYVERFIELANGSSSLYVRLKMRERY